MYLVYADDSGDSNDLFTVTGLFIRAEEWSEVLEAWLQGRQRLRDDYGVDKWAELHGSSLFKGRGRIWATEHDVAKYNSLRYRRAIGRRALKALAGTRARVLTVAVPKEKSKEAYGAFVAWVENWAESIGEYVIIFFDGLQPDFPIAPGERDAEHWGTAIRQAAPYRAVHHQLPLHGRRVIEDVVMKDSKRNQLIQAADLAAYGAFHLISRDWPEWCPRHKADHGAVDAYMALEPLWWPGCEKGIVFLDE